MARQAWGFRRAAARLAGSAVCVVVTASAVLAQPASQGTVENRLRPADRGAAILLEAGQALSSTFRELTAAIERSDLIVYVETRPDRLPGQLQFVAATPACRFVRVSIKTPGLPRERVAWLAHELRHAVEIATAPEIRDQATLRRYYERIGDGGRYSDRVESSAAQDTGLKVMLEMRAR